MDKLKENIPTFVENINRRCPPYQKGVKIQNKPMNTNFEKLVSILAYETFKDMGIPVKNAISEHLSDTALEWHDGILQLDAKGCLVTDLDFTLKRNGFNLHCGEAQTCLSTQNGEKIVQGLQKNSIDGKPVHTLLTFMKWGYNEQYYVHSFGWADTSPPPGCKKDRGGKTTKEMRFVITDPNYYQVFYLRDGQILDSTQLEDTGFRAVLQLDP
jgi:hypothetical protein